MNFTPSSRELVDLNLDLTSTYIHVVTKVWLCSVVLLSGLAPLVDIKLTHFSNAHTVSIL